jgi:hypothetical protein
MIYHCIQQLSQAGFVVLHSRQPRSKLVPGTDLEHAVSFVNSCLQHCGRDLIKWNYGEQDQIARLLWVNLFYQNLQHQPIRKPLLVQPQHNQLCVVCGDTRLMVLDLANHTDSISTVMIVPAQQVSHYPEWTVIYCNQQLIQQLKFDQSAEITIRFDSAGSVDWFDIGDSTTAVHLHDLNTRIQLMQHYLDCGPLDFVFTLDWAKNKIDWHLPSLLN